MEMKINIILYPAICFYFTSGVVDSIPLQKNPDVYMSNIDQIKKYGYPVEVHNITTKDGYILTSFRIPYGINSRSKKPGIPVILSHGLGGAGDYFLTLGPGRALGYYLANEGYDVWLFNARGSRYSRKHITLDPDKDDKFWRFSWHEIGIYDTAANIDYILNLTKHPKLFYIGHSQGCTVIIVLLAERPEYNDKVHVSVHLGAPILPKYMKSAPIVQIIANFRYVFEYLVDLFHILEMVPNNSQFNYDMKTACSERTEMLELCTILIYMIGGSFSALLNRTSIPVFLNTIPAGASIFQILHYIQNLNTDHFAKYDFGPQKNMQLYNQTIPPDYNLNNVVSPVALLYGRYDLFGSRTQMKALKKLLPNVVMDYEVPYVEFNHIDFIIGVNATELVYMVINKLFRRYS